VTDTVAGFLAAAATDSAFGQPLNIGSGFEITIGDLATRILALTDSSGTIEVDAERLRPEGGEVDRLWCDSTQAQRLLGWSPKVSLDEGLLETIRWVSEFRDFYSPAKYSI
jgi:nucleoside-diphosphate-sugar epimerase